MNKIIATGSLLAMTALGMACGGTSTNVNANLASNKMANNTAVVIPAITATPMSSPSNMAPPMNSNMKPANSMTNSNSMMKPSNMNKPANK